MCQKTLNKILFVVKASYYVRITSNQNDTSHYCSNGKLSPACELSIETTAALFQFMLTRVAVIQGFLYWQLYYRT